MVEIAMDQGVNLFLVFCLFAQVDIQCSFYFEVKNKTILYYFQWIANGQAGPVIHHVLNILKIKIVENQETDT